ncbi:hypothetical protein F1728_25145 [Gimesia benthica]|uniref:Uncharacterized protein n=1 Tax=Gimesia benthica TaxID=2608982 RepID=A0A6I6AI21_9PLAN|nr:hypothetical protein [Gimesia benthica]QGQ25756.1 hypothetical protein F1728_25145 [Gimesia benthica]
MAEITGSITTFKPDNGSSFPSGTSVDVNAQGSVTVPAAQNGVQDTYKVSIRLSVYSNTNCTTVSRITINTYEEVFVPKTYTTSKPSQPISDDGYYQATATMVSQKKRADGTFGPETTLDLKIWQFKIGTPNDTQPSAFFCSGQGAPATGCVGPVPADGTENPPPVTVKIDGRYKVAGSNSSTKTYVFTFELKVTGPESATFINTIQTTGVLLTLPFSC